MITSDDIKKALYYKYTEPEWFIGFEVGNSTGAELRRHADAVAINTYPSKKFEVRGFEIKVSKQDLQRELDNGLKADEIARYCNYWFLVTPKGLTKGMQIPEPWGIIEYDGDKLRQIKKAEYFNNTPDMGFMIAFMRGCERVARRFDDEYRDMVEESVKERVIYEYRQKVEDYDRLKKQFDEIKANTGVDVCHMSKRDERVLKVANHISGLSCMQANVDYNLRELTEICERLKKVMSEIRAITGVHDA